MLALIMSCGILMNSSIFSGGGDAANPPIDYPGDLKIKTRSSWLAAPPVSNIKSPVGIVIIAHTATPNCSNTSVCSKRVYSIQEYHQKSLHLDDVTYNFLIGGDGYAYEGRGFNSSGHCAKDLKASKICIAFIGSFGDVAPTDQQLDTAQRLLEVGVAEKKLSADYSLYGHRQFTTTESPGTRLFNIIKTWEHWREITSH